MLSQVADAARGGARGGALVPTVLTFAPHPRQFFAEQNRRPELSPPQINGLRDKLCALEQAGIEQVVLARFNRAFAEMSAQDFIEKLLIQGLQAKWLIVGEDFRFGRQRSGDVALLKKSGRSMACTSIRSLKSKTSTAIVCQALRFVPRWPPAI